MRIKKYILLVLFVFYVLPVSAKESEYVRDYNYYATKFDSEYTSRINAVEGVKTTLLEEIGTYIQSIITMKQDSKGEDFFKKDTVALTAGIISMKVLREKWDYKKFYIKASMKADPNEVQQAVEALRNDHQLESALRDTLKDLKTSKAEINELKKQLERQKDAQKQSMLASEYINKVKDIEAEEAFRIAMQAHINGDFNEAFMKLETLAEQGYAKAQTKIAFMYERGMAVKQDYTKAHEWYNKAIKNGDAEALVRHGFMYERGMGVAVNFDKAAELYREAVTKGSKMAYAFLGTLFQFGTGVPQDFQQAFKLYKKGEAFNDPISFARLGAYYMTGAFSVEQDHVKAREYFTKSAKEKHPVGMAYLGFMNLKGIGGEEDLKLGNQLIRESVRYYIPLGLSFLGLIYEQGLGEEQNYDKALEYYKKSVEVGSPFGEFRLGIMYLKGLGVSRDRDEGLYWLKKASDKGHPKAKEVYERVSSRF